MEIGLWLEMERGEGEVVVAEDLFGFLNFGKTVDGALLA